MKFESLKKRLDKHRPMTTITIRMPEDVIEDLKRIAPLLGFSGYQPLARTYIGQGLRADLERLEADTLPSLIASLKRRGVSEEVISDCALNEQENRRFLVREEVVLDRALTEPENRRFLVREEVPLGCVRDCCRDALYGMTRVRGAK